MPLYLGFDSSTQGLTAMVIRVDDGARDIVFQETLNYERDLPEYGTTAGVHYGADRRVVFSSPIMWADALDRMMGRVARGVDIGDIRAIAGSGQQHGSVYLTTGAAAVWRQLDPTRAIAEQIAPTFSREDSPVWMDESTSTQCAAIEDALGGPEATAHLTGSRAYERFTGPQVRRFFEERPDAYARTARIHLVSSYLASLLAGADAPIDPGDGAGMNLMDLRRSQWSAAALAATAPELDRRLPRVAPSWTVTGPLSKYWQQRYGFAAARVVAWSGDNPCSLVGTGIVREGDVAISLGTSDTVFAAMQEPRPGASHIFGSPAGGYMGLLCFRNGSLAREHVRDQHGLDWPGFSHALRSTPAGNDGALMLPWFEPEITPHVVTAGVARLGLDPNDGPRNVRAIVEAQMIAMANHSQALPGGRIERLVATGGASRNREMLQVMADVFGVEVRPLAAGNAACMGAALRALHADRFESSAPLGWDEVVRGFTEPAAAIAPIPAHVARYGDLKRRYAAFEAETRRTRAAR
jgi:xylulokinase